MAYPPPGHPHYMPDAEREALANRFRYVEPEEETMPSAAQKKYQDLREQIVAARKKMQETAKGLFTEMSAELFADNPELVSFSWTTQYTPYFNDGDVCEFRCNGDYPSISMKVGDDIVGYDSNSGDLEINGEEVQDTYDLTRKFKDLGVDSFTKGGKQYVFDAKTQSVTVDGTKIPTAADYEKVFDKMEKKVAAFLNAFEEEDMETMFGDHMRVTVTRDDIETEEYQHD